MNNVASLQVGDKVKNISKSRFNGVTGTITHVYQAHAGKDEDGNKYVFQHVEVQVSPVPKYWPYLPSDKYAPDVVDLVKATGD